MLEKRIGIQGLLLVKNRQSTTPPASSNDSEKLLIPPAEAAKHPKKPVEVGGPKGPEPTRYGDWEKAGRCSDF